jgi:L-asparaginase
VTAVVLANRIGEPGVAEAIAAIRDGKPALDAVEAGIRPIESDPSVRSVGVGGWTNLLGAVELDAAVMCGRTLRCGGVGALQGYAHPVSVARKVMELLPHVLLVGEGAARFAEEVGAERGELLTDEARREWLSWLDKHVPESARRDWQHAYLAKWSRLTADPETAKGTTCFVVRDSFGDLAVGVSTCGWAFKYPGRIGDSPVAGAGLYADNRYGAAACTGQGELALRASTARSTVQYMKSGLSVEDACGEALADLRALQRDFRGGLALHAMDSVGGISVRTIGLSREIGYWLWREGESGKTNAIADALDW